MFASLECEAVLPIYISLEEPIKFETPTDRGINMQKPKDLDSLVAV